MFTKLDQHSISSLTAYLVAIRPFAFIWPSQVYRTALLPWIERIVLLIGNPEQMMIQYSESFEEIRELKYIF